ncbi:MAG TPA: DUF1353 domain-containing protein [Gemmatimonadaceae bacterium]
MSNVRITRPFPSAVLLAVIAGCAKPVTAPAPRTDALSSMVAAVGATRIRLDSVVLEIHRLSGDSSSAATARSRQLRATASKLDSTYRVRFGDLLAAITASTGMVHVSTARFPLEKSKDPFVRAFADGANWMLQSPLIYQIGKNSAAIVIVPRGFVTDFASLPQPLRALRDLMPSTDRYGIPALVHDYLYWRQDCTRDQADDIMEIALKDAGVSLLERKVVHEGLRQFGQSAWDGNRRARESGLVRTVGPPYDQVPLTGTWPEYRHWLQTVHAPGGVEYRVPASVCAAATDAASN